MLAAQESDSESEEDEDNIVMCTLCSQKVDCNHHNIYIFSKEKEEKTLCESCCAQNKRMYKRDGWECDDFDDDEEEDDDECDEEEGWNCCKCKCDFKESEVEHIEEVDDAVCYTCCVKYGYSVVSQQEEKMIAAQESDSESEDEGEDDEKESLAFEKMRRDAKRPQTFTETYEDETPEKRERLLILQANCKEAYEAYVALTNADQDTRFCKDCDEPLVDGYTFNTDEGSVCVDCLDSY